MALDALHTELRLKTRATPTTLGPYTPTPDDVVRHALNFALLNPPSNSSSGEGVVLFDVGCGDGRLLVEALSRRGVDRVSGWEVDPQAASDARENLRRHLPNGEGTRWKIVEGDVLSAVVPWEEADTVVLYLLVRGNLLLRDDILKRCRNGTTVVTVSFHMGDWDPVETLEVESRHGHHRDKPTFTLRRYVVDEETRGRLGGRAKEEIEEYTRDLSEASKGADIEGAGR